MTLTNAVNDLLKSKAAVYLIIAIAAFAFGYLLAKPISYKDSDSPIKNMNLPSGA